MRGSLSCIEVPMRLRRSRRVAKSVTRRPTLPIKEKGPHYAHFEFASGEVGVMREDAGKGVLEAQRTCFHCPLGLYPD